jgi:hypothetical protein
VSVASSVRRAASFRVGSRASCACITARSSLMPYRSPRA